jgi:hypothetical protein
VPDVDAQAALVTTPEPSRLRTVSRVSHLPEMMSQVGNRSRSYVVVCVHAATVSEPSSVFAVEAAGTPGGVAAAGPPKPSCAMVASSATASVARAKREFPIVVHLYGCGRLEDQLSGAVR